MFGFGSYDFAIRRRSFLQKVATRASAPGVLAPLLATLIANSADEIRRPTPDEAACRSPMVHEGQGLQAGTSFTPPTWKLLKDLLDPI